MKSVLRRQIAVPQDYGSWVFIFSPLLIGIFEGRGVRLGTVAFTLCAGIAFLLRQPLTTIVKIYSGRRARTDLPAALFWMLACGLIGLFGFAALAVLGDGFAA